jgi:hypothetical protein
MENGFVARFERKILFRITRWVALGLCMLLFLALAGAGLMLAGTMSSGVDRPDPTALRSAESDAASNDDGEPGELASDSSSLLTGLRMPPILQEKFVSGKNREVLEAWLADIERADRQDFVDALGQAAEAARKAGQDEAEGINGYRSRYNDYLLERKLAEAKASADRLQLIAAIGSALALIALFSLVLVLMAIERNTRTTAAQEA